MRKLTDKHGAVAQESCGLLFLALGIHFVVWGLVAVGAWLLLPFLIRALRGR